MNYNNYMHLDIWREILVRLPAESLIRSRAVCKGWQAVIDDPCFVRAHTNNHQHQQFSWSKIIIIQNKIGGYSLDLEALSSGNGQQSITATPLDLGDSPAGLSSQVGACNGLILNDEPLSIWNPLTHERLGLPRGEFYFYSRRVASGLWYDSTTDDYKVVVIEFVLKTHVYSLKSDSWRRIMDCRPCDGDWRGPVGAGVLVCGRLNWLSIAEGGEYDDKIVALDLGTEKYSLLQMPSHKTRRNEPKYPPRGMLLNVLGGRLALCDYGNTSHLDVWVMKDYGNEDSWFKLFSIERPEQNVSVSWTDFLRPVAFMMKDRLVFLQQGYKSFFVFDVETKSLKRVKIDTGEDSFFYAQQMFVGNIFRLHANCGGGRKIAPSSEKKKASASASARLELVFCMRDAKGKNHVDLDDSCSSSECLSGENEDDTELFEDSICSYNSSSPEDEDVWFSYVV